MLEKVILRFAGTVILTASLLTYFHDINWIWVDVFVGANLLQSTFTGFCPLAIILKKLGLKSGSVF